MNTELNTENKEMETLEKKQAALAKKRELKNIRNKKYYYLNIEKSREYHRGRYVSKKNDKLQSVTDELNDLKQKYELLKTLQV